MVRLLGHHGHPYYGDWLLEVERPARYIGCEHGIVRKPPDSVRSRFLFAFPDLYDIGMSHMGLRILLSVVNADPDLSCERAFMPWPDMEAQLRKRDIPLVSLETAAPLSAFHVIGFSLQYELTYTNVLAMLDLGGVPVRSDRRGESDPVVLAGGPAASHAEPLAPFVDLFVLGEAEETITRILRKEADLREEGVSRRERIAALDRLAPCFAPALHPAELDPAADRVMVSRAPDGSARAQRVWVESLADVPDPSMGPIPSVEAVFDRISVEVMRGCIQGCRFCQAGFMYRPVRERSADDIAGILSEALARTGWDEASLTALSPADHPHLEEMMRSAAEVLRPVHGSVSVSSLRAYGLDGSLLDDLRTGRGGGLTFAPEAGTDRMRSVVNKNVSAEELIRTASEVARRGWSRIKLYFMIGLPSETDEDIEAIVDLGLNVQRAARSAASGRPPVVTLSVSTFVPKPHTPLQWAEMIPLKEIRRRQALLKRAVSGTRLKLRTHGPATSVLEAVLARADRRAAAVVERAYELGCRFDGWEDQLNWKGWIRAFKDCSVEMETYLGAIEPGSNLWWDHLDMGIDPEFLASEFRKALAARSTEVCGVRPGASGTAKEKVLCHQCGVECDLEAMADGALSPAAVPAGEVAAGAGAGEVPAAASGSVTLDFDSARRFLIEYAKTGPATLWGHLDLVRHLPRVFRRAGFMPAYSTGFHPKAQIIFGPALPLGWRGLRELAEVKIEAVPHEPSSTLTDLLRRVSPEGLEPLALIELEPGSPKLQKTIAGADYLFELSAEDGNHADRAAERSIERAIEKAAEKAAELMSSSEAIIQVDRRKGPRSIDIRPYVAELNVAELDVAELEVTGLDAAGLDAASADPGEGGSVFEIRFSLRTGGPRPQEVVEFIAGPAIAFKATRLGFFTEREGDRTPVAVAYRSDPPS